MSKSVIAIDPGPVQSAWVCYDGVKIGKGLGPNAGVRLLLHHVPCAYCVIEMIASYGMPAGASLFNTCVEIGRFVECFDGPVELITRMKVKHHVCNSARAGDSNIRQALIDRFGPVGTKKNQGPLYGVKKDIWAALAVAVTWWDQNRESTNA